MYQWERTADAVRRARPASANHVMRFAPSMSIALLLALLLAAALAAPAQAQPRRMPAGGGMGGGRMPPPPVREVPDTTARAGARPEGSPPEATPEDVRLAQREFERLVSERLSSRREASLLEYAAPFRWRAILRQPGRPFP